MQSRLKNLFRIDPITIVVMYTVVGILWVLFSDQLLYALIVDADTLMNIQSIKGVVYVLVTGVLLYILIEFSNEKVRVERELVDKALESLNIATWTVNLASGDNTTSQDYIKIFGLEEDLDSWSPQDFFDHIHPDDQARVEQEYLDALNSESLFESEYRIVLPEGNTHWMRSMGNIIYNEKGEKTHISGIIADITGRKELEKEYEREKELFEKMFDQIPVMIDVNNPGNGTARVNQAFVDKMGWTNKEIQEMDIMKAIYPDPAERKRAEQVVQEANGEWHTFEVTNKEGQKHIQRWSNIELTDQTKIGFGLDITERTKYEQELKDRNDFIETTIEHLPIGVAVNYIHNGSVQFMNNKFSSIYGWPKEVLNDVESFFMHVYPDEAYRKQIIEMVTTDLESRDPNRMNWEGVEVQTQSGETRIVNAKNIPLYDQNLMISTVIDVTEQKKLERKLRESDNNYRLLFQQNPLPMWIYNPQTLEFVEVNEAAVKHYGYSKEEFYSMTLLDIRPPEDHQKLKKIIPLNEKGLTDSEEWKHIKKSGEIIQVRVTGSSINYFGEKYRLVLLNDITQQKKAEEMVLASLVEGENKERARIAQELHDGLGQNLAAANMNLDAIKDDINQLNNRKQKQFNKGLNLLKHAITETAQISRNLMPRVVDDYGLALAIEALVDNYANNNGLSINYYQNIEDVSLSQEVEFNLYRIAQEGLSNAVKYAEATEINVQLIKDELDLILTIDDNGVGFDIQTNEFTKGIGLQTIKTRTGALGGEFELESKPGKGTLINVVVPLNRQSTSGK